MSIEGRAVNHTPGPWLAKPRDQVLGFVVLANDINAANDLPCAVVPKNKRPSDVVEANARLIAAAPDMLAALISLVEGIELRGLDDGKWHHNQNMIADARAAIAKAEGVR